MAKAIKLATSPSPEPTMLMRNTILLPQPLSEDSACEILAKLEDIQADLATLANSGYQPSPEQREVLSEPFAAIAAFLKAPRKSGLA